MLKEKDILRQQAAHTGEALAAKIRLFEDEVRNRVESTKGTIEEMWTDAKENVSVVNQTRRHPLPAVGAAALAGFLAIRWFSREKHSPALLSKISSEFSEELQTLKMAGLSFALQKLSEKIKDAAPEIAEKISTVSNHVLTHRTS